MVVGDFCRSVACACVSSEINPAVKLYGKGI